MRFVHESWVASANFQACGVWLQSRHHIWAVLPEWWWDEHDRRQRGGTANHVFGLKLWAWDHNGGVHTVFEVRTTLFSISYKRAFRTPVSEDRKIGWEFRRRRRASA